MVAVRRAWEMQWEDQGVKIVQRPVHSFPTSHSRPREIPDWLALFPRNVRRNDPLMKQGGCQRRDAATAQGTVEGSWIMPPSFS